MAETLKTQYTTTAANLYAIVRDSAGLVWDGNTFVTYTTANLGDYDLAMTEQGTASRFYTVAMPSVGVGTYSVVVFVRAGGSPAETDLPIAAGQVEWTGTLFVATGTIKAETDKLADTLEDDAGTFRFTANALEEAPTGGSAPSAADIADAVWEETLTDHSGTAGSTAEALGAAGSAGDPWATALPGSYSSGQAGKIIGDNLNATVGSRATQTSVDDVPTNAELATALGTADDAVLAAIAALNNLSIANVRTAVGLASANLDTQLGDLPTNAELATALASADDAVLAAIAALNNLSSAQAQTAAAAALTAYDPPTRSEATSDKAEILTAVGDVPTNAELSTALAAADDAVLAAIAALNNLSAAQVNAEVDTAITDAALATAAALGTAQTAITAIKAKSDSLTFTVAGHVDANVQQINDVALIGDGDAVPWGPA